MSEYRPFSKYSLNVAAREAASVGNSYRIQHMIVA